MLTTYFANVRNLPHDVVPIAISQTVPNSVRMLRYPALAPHSSILYKYKADGDWGSYTVEYKKQLESLDPREVFEDLVSLAGTDEIALVCYEGKNKDCHRHLVADWFKAVGIEVEEY